MYDGTYIIQFLKLNFKEIYVNSECNFIYFDFDVLSLHGTMVVRELI